MAAARLVAVTGATGFLGRHLVRTFAEQGWRVRILARRDPICPEWRGLELEVVPGGLSDTGGLASLCEGADAVVHSAGLVKARSRTAFFAANSMGAGYVARAAAEAGVGQFVLVSSLAAREPELSNYSASKRAGEAVVAEALEDRLTIVRPPAIYGPGDLEVFRLLKAAATSPVLPVFSRKTRIAFIHVEDAARQIVALAQGAAQGRTVTLSDNRPEGYGWREIVQAATAAVGSRPLVAQVPDAVFTLLGAVGALKRLGGGTPMVTPGKARELRHKDWSVTPNEQIKGLPKVQFGLAEGFSQTALWARRVGMLAN